MMLHSYPLLISIYKGEGRMLIVPLIDHIAGYSIDSDWFINLSDLDNAVSVGEGVKSAMCYIFQRKKIKIFNELYGMRTLKKIYSAISKRLLSLISVKIRYSAK